MRHGTHIKALGAALAALMVGLLSGDRVQALDAGAGDHLDVTAVTENAGGSTLSMPSGACSPQGSCTHTNAPAQYRISTTGTELTIDGKTTTAPLDASCDTFPAASPCLLVEAISGDAGFTGMPGMLTSTLLIFGSSTADFQAVYDFSASVSGDAQVVIRTRLYAEAAQSTLLTEEFFVVEYQDPSSAEPVVCFTNIPPVNELGRRTTRISSFAAGGRIEPNQSGTAVPNPVASAWPGACGTSAVGADDKVAQILLDKDGSTAVSSSAAVAGSAAGCSEPQPPLSATTACDDQGGAHYPYGTFTLGAVSLNGGTVTSLSLEGRNDAGLTSMGGQRFSGGLRDAFDIYLDNSAPTLGGGNLVLLEPDFDTRQSFNATEPVTVRAGLGQTTVNLLGSMSDAAPGRIAFAGRQYAGSSAIANLDARNGRMLVRVEDYKRFTADGRSSMKAGDFVRFDPDSANPNNGRSARIHSIAEQTVSIANEAVFTNSAAGSAGPFSGSLAHDMVAGDGAFNLRSETTGELCSDADSDGALTCDMGGSGMIDYRTGEFGVTFGGALANGDSVLANYNRIYAFMLDLSGDSYPGAPSVPGEQINDIRVIQVLNNTAYQLDVNGETYGIVSDGSATASEIVNALAACLTTPGSCNTSPVDQAVLGFARTDSDGSERVVQVEPATLGDGFDLSIPGGSSARMQFVPRAVQGAELVEAEQVVEIAVGGVQAGSPYTVTINGNDYTIDSGGSPTITTILQALADCIAVPASNCNNTPPAPVGITVSGPAGSRLTIEDTTPGAAPATGFAVSVSSNLSAAAQGTIFTAYRSAYAALQPTLNAGSGVLDFNDAGAVQARAFDQMLTRGALATGMTSGDWVLFAPNDAVNADRRFRILSVNAGARTVTVSTTSAGGQTLGGSYGGVGPRVFFLRNASGRIDGDDPVLGYNCGRCAGESWALDLDLQQGSKLFNLVVFDDAGNKQSTPWLADITFDPIVVSADAPMLLVDRLWLYPDPASAASDTPANVSPSLACDPDGAGAGVFNGNPCNAGVNPGCHELSLNSTPVGSGPTATGDGAAMWNTVTIAGDLVASLGLTVGDSILSNAFTNQVPAPIYDISVSAGNTTIAIAPTNTTAMSGDYEIYRKQQLSDRVIGQCTGLKMVGRIILDDDPEVPAYDPGDVPEFTFEGADFSANVAHDPAFNDGRHFVWFVDRDVPIERRAPDESLISRTNMMPATPDVFTYVSGGATVPTGCSSLPGGTITSRVNVLGEDLVSAIGLSQNDEIALETTDNTYGPLPIICVRVVGGDTVIEFQATTITGDPIEYWVPRATPEVLTSFSLMTEQDNVSNSPTGAALTGYTLDRSPPKLAVTGFIEDQRNVNFSPSVAISDNNLALTPEVVTSGGTDLDFTNPGSPWQLVTGTNTEDCASGTTATLVRLMGIPAAAAIDPVTDVVEFETNGGSFGPAPILSAADAGGNTEITIGETCVNAAPSVATHNVQVLRTRTRIRLFRATDLASDVSRLEVDIDSITNDLTPGDNFGVPLVTEASDPSCATIGPIPDPQCDGVPVTPIPVCRSSFYTLPNGYNPDRTCDSGAGCTIGGQYPYRVLCEVPITRYNAFSNVIIGNHEDERGSYRFEIYAADTAVPPNVLAQPSVAGDTGPIDMHFSAVITDSQAFLNDMILIFLNEGGSELNPLDLCPADLQGDPQSLFECLIDPAFTVLSDNPTDVREGGSALGFFFEAMAFVIGSPSGTTTTGTDDTAFNSMAQTALGAFEQLFPSLFNDGATDSDIATFLNLLKNGIDRHIFDELTTITIGALIDPDNDALTADGIESLEPLVEHIMQNDGSGFRVAVNDDGTETTGVQDKSSSPFIRLTPAMLDLLSYEDFRGTIDVLNEMRFLSVPRINDLGTITLEQRPAMPLLYGAFEALFDGFDPLLLVDTVKGTSAVVYDSGGDGEQNPFFETRCYEAPDPAATSLPTFYTGTPRAETPTDCFCAPFGVVADAQYCLNPDDTVADPFSDSRHFARTLRLLSDDNCAAITNEADKTACEDFIAGTGPKPDYEDPRSEIYEGSSLDNLRWIMHQMLDSENPPGVAGVSTLTSLLDLILCAFEPVRSGRIQRNSPVDRLFPIVASIINQTGTRDLAECSAGGQFLQARLNDVQCQGNGWAPEDGDDVGPARLIRGARGVECPVGERLLVDINNVGLAPGEYCNSGELIFTKDDAFSSLLPAIETFTDPYVLDEVNRVFTEFPDIDVVLEGLVAASDQGLLNRTLITIATIFDNYDNGQRSSVPECGTPGAPTGGCRPPAQPMADIVLDSIGDLLVSARSPLVTCSSTSANRCEDGLAPGVEVSMGDHPSCKVEGQQVFCNAEDLPIAIMLDLFDELFVENPPVGCEFYVSGTSVPGGGEPGMGPGSAFEACENLRQLDFDPVNSLWDFLDDFVNESITQADRDSVVEMLPNMMGSHRRSATGIPTAPNLNRVIPGPRPTITVEGMIGNHDALRPEPDGTAADALIWPPDRAFPSPLLECSQGGAPSFAPDGVAAPTCWQPELIFESATIPGRNNGRNPFDRFLCDDFDCDDCGGDSTWTDTMKMPEAAANNQTACADKLTQKLRNPYFGCWKEGAGINTNSWDNDVLFSADDAMPETPADCADSNDLVRSLDEATRVYFGLDLELLLLGLVEVDVNALLNTVAGFADPDLLPTANFTYKVFGLGAGIPKAEVLSLFGALRAARALLGNPLLGGGIIYSQDCTGFTAAETGSFANSFDSARGLTNGIDRTAGIEPLIRDTAFEPLQRMLSALVLISNRPSADPNEGLFQTNTAVEKCKYSGAVASDVLPIGHPDNVHDDGPGPPQEQLIWGQGPVLLTFLTDIESIGYAQPALSRTLISLELGPTREVLDALFEVLGDWREVTADLDPRIPPGSNFMRVALDAVDNLISPRDGTTVPCGNDGRPCESGEFGLGTDEKGFYKDSDATPDGSGPTDAEPFIYPLLPTMLDIGGVKLSETNAILRRCTDSDWSFGVSQGCTSENGYGLLIPEVSTTFEATCAEGGVCDCDAVNNGGVCPGDARADFVYINCMGTSTDTCDATSPGGKLLPGVGGPSEDYSYLGHKFRVVHRLPNCTAGDGGSGTCLVVAHEAFDNPVITIDQSPDLALRFVDYRIHSYVRATGTKGLRALGKAIVDDFNQDPDVPGVDIFEVDEVLADLVRCDTDGFLLDSVLSFLDDRTPVSSAPNGDLRALRNAIFTLNNNATTRDAQLDIIGSTLGATGGAEISYADYMSNHPDPDSCTPLGGSRGLCRGDAPLTGLGPILREGAVVDPLEQFALQKSLDNLLNPFNPVSNSRLSNDPAACDVEALGLNMVTNGFGVPVEACTGFVDPIFDAIVDASSFVTTDRSTGNDPKIAEISSAGWQVPDPTVPQTDPTISDNLTAYRAQLAQINNGAGVSGLDTYTSLSGDTGDCDIGPNRPDGILDDCAPGNNIPDFIARFDDGTPDGFYNGGGNKSFMVGHWYYNDTGDDLEIVSVSFFHDGVAGQTAVTNDPARVGRIRALATSIPFSAPGGNPNIYVPSWDVGEQALDSCMFEPTNQDPCMGGEMLVHDFYFRDRSGIQTVPIHPTLTVEPGQYAVITIQQPGATAANRFGIGVDTRAYTTFNEVWNGAGSFTPPDFYSDQGAPADFTSPAFTPPDSPDGRLKKLADLTGMNAVPIIRVGFTTPITMAETDAPFESALALFRRMFNKPSPFSPAPDNNPERRRPIEPLADALVALALPLDVAPKDQINNNLAVPANCEREQGASGKADIFVFLPHFYEPDGTLRRQRCDYPGGSESGAELEMEAGLGCFDPDGTTPGNVPCYATPRGMVPADLDDDRDYVTPLELNLPLFKRLLLATYPDPIPNDPNCPAEATPGPADGQDCVDPDMVMVDTLTFFELLMAPVPPLSCSEVNALGGVCDQGSAAISQAGAMTSLIDRLLVLPKILVEASNDPALWRYRFFEHPADATCGGVEDPQAKCDATSAKLLNVLSGLATPVTLYDRVTGITDPEPRPILIRLLDRYTDAFFPENVTPPALPPQALQPRISLRATDTEVIMREGYGVGADTDCTSTDPDTGAPIQLPGCKYFLDLTVNHGQIAGVETTINEQQHLEFNLVPDAGQWSLTYDDGMSMETTANLPATANAQAVANALNSLSALSDVDVAGDYADGFDVSFNGIDGGKDHLQLSASDSLTSGGMPVTITPSTTCDYGEPCILGGSQPMAGAVVSVNFPTDVGAGNTNALHAAAFHDAGETGDSLLAFKIADGSNLNPGPDTYSIQDGDVLEYGMLVPSISHVREVGINMVFTRANDAVCNQNGNDALEPETIRVFDSLPLAQQQCLQEGTLRFGTATDQLSRPADTGVEIEAALDQYIIRQIPLTESGPNQISYLNRVIDSGSDAGVYIEFNTVDGAPRGRAEVYFSFIRIVQADGTVIPVYQGEASPPSTFTVGQSRGYYRIDEDNTASLNPDNGFTVGMDVDTRSNSILCPEGAAPGECPVVAGSCGVYDSDFFSPLTAPAIGDRGCDSPDGSIRIRTDSQGRVRIPVIASTIPFDDRIEIQVRCDDPTMDFTPNCDEQESATAVEVAIRKGGDSAPVFFTAKTRYPPRPMDVEFESRDQNSRPVYQTVAIDDPEVTNIKSGEPAEDDAFFLDTRVLDQNGDPFTGFYTNAATPVFDDEELGIDYAVISRPALHLDIAGVTANTSLTVIGTGAERSTGPYIAQEGDYLEYEVYFEPGDGSDNVGIDMQSAEPDGGSLDLRLAAIPGMKEPAAGDQGILAGPLVGPTSYGGDVGGKTAATAGRALDQNLRPAHPGINLRGQGTPAADSNFYYRRIPIPEGFELSKSDAVDSVSESSRVFAALWDSNGSGNTDVWYRNIRIGNGGRSKYEIYDQDTGLRPMTLSGSPCNDKTSGAGGGANCPSSVSSLSCPGGGTDYAFVFDGFTGLDVEATGGGDLVMILDRVAAAEHTTPANNGFSGQNSLYTSDTRLIACNVIQDPIVVFEVSNGPAPTADFRDGMAIFVANQGGSGAFNSETNRQVSSDLGAGGSVEMCADSVFGADCTTTSPLASAAIGEGRFCTNGTGASQYGQRCTDGLMRTVHTADSPDTYNAGRSHLVQRAKQVAAGDGGDGSLYRYVYTMGVSSGRQSVEVRTAGAIAGLNAETVPYANLLPSRTFIQFGTPPAVPAEIIFDSEFEEEPFNGRLGAPGSFADIHVQLLDQYGTPWTGAWPLKWEITSPKNAIKMRGTAAASSAFLGLKLNTGVTARPRWHYPLTNGRIPHSNDVDLHTGGGDVGLGGLSLAADSENSDGDRLILFNQNPTGLLPGDTIRIGMNQNRTVTATVANVYGALVEIENIRYLGGECDFTGGDWGYHSGTGQDANLFSTMVIPSDRKSASSGLTGTPQNCVGGTTLNVQGYPVYVTNPTTAGDDALCNEFGGGTNPNLTSPPRCERPGDVAETEGSDRFASKYGSCRGGNFDRGADGAWRDLTTYKSDDGTEDSNEQAEFERHCFETNFELSPSMNSSGSGFNHNSDIAPLAAESPPMLTRDTAIGSTRFNYGSYGTEIEPNGDCGFANGQAILGLELPVGTLAWTCAPGSIRSTILAPTLVDNDPMKSDPAGHVGIDFAGVVEMGDYKELSLNVEACIFGICIPFSGTHRQPNRSRATNLATAFTTGSYIHPYTSRILVGTTDPDSRQPADPITVWGEMGPTPNPGSPNEPNPIDDKFPYEAGALTKFNAYAPIGGGGESNGFGFPGVDSFATRFLLMPRTGMHFTNRSGGATVTKLLCQGEAFSSNPAVTCSPGSNAHPHDPSKVQTVAYARQGLWMAMMESTTDGGSSVGRHSEFYLRSVEMTSANDVGTIATASVDASLFGLVIPVDLPLLLVIPNFVTHQYYDGGSLLPSTAVSNYERAATSQLDPSDGTNANTDAFVDPEIQIAGGQVKLCAESNIQIILPQPLPDTPLLDGEFAMPGCPATRTGQSRPGSFAIARTNDPGNNDGKMYGRLYFPPWPNETVEVAVSAPGVPALRYSRNIVRGTPAGTGADINQRPVALDPPTAIGDPPTVYPSEHPVETQMVLTGTDDGPVSELVVNVDDSGLMGTLDILSGQAPLTVGYTPPNGFTEATSFTFTVTDRNGTGAVSFAETVDIFVIDPSKRPLADPAGPINGTEDNAAGPESLSGTVNTGGVGPIQIQISSVPSNGRICLDTGCATELTPASPLQADGVNVYYVPDPDFCGSDSFEFVARDVGVIPSPGAPSQPELVNINISCVNDPPTFVGESSPEIFEDQSYQLRYIIQEVDDTGSDILTLTITSSNGNVTLGSTTGVTCNPNCGPNMSMTVDGTLGDLNNALFTAEYLSTPLHFNDTNPADRITLTVNDNGSSGSGAAMQTTQQVNFAVLPSNDPPQLTGGPASISLNEDSQVCLSPAFTIDDSIDNHNNEMQVTLSASLGGLWLVSEPAGITMVTGGGGTPSSSVVFRGLQADLNAALADMNVCYQGNPNASGSDTIAVSVNDLGNVDANLAAASATLQIPTTINAVDDPPQALINDPSAGASNVTEAGQDLTGAPGGGLDIPGPSDFLTLETYAIVLDAPVLDVNVTLTVTPGCGGTQWNQDYEAWLDHPGGDSVLLISQRGGNDNSGMQPTVFDDEAAESITSLVRNPNDPPPDDGVSITGTYQAEVIGAGLDSLEGLSAAGKWRVRIRDNSGFCFSNGQPAKLNSFVVSVTTDTDDVVISPGELIDIRGTCTDIEGDPATLHSWNGRGTILPFDGMFSFPPYNCRTTLGGTDGAGCPDWAAEKPSDAVPMGPFLPDAQSATSVTYGLTYECDAGGQPSNVAAKNVTIVNNPPTALMISPNPNAPQCMYRSDPFDAGEACQYWNIGSTGGVSDDDNNNFQNFPSSTVSLAGSPVIRTTGIDIEVCLSTDGDFLGDTRVNLRSPAGTEIQLWGRGGHGGGCRTITNIGSFDGQTPNGTWTIRADDNDCHPNFTGSCQSGDEGSVDGWSIRIRYRDTAGVEMVPAGNAVNFQAICSDPDGHTPLTYEWNFNDTGLNPPVCTYPTSPCNLLSPGDVVLQNAGLRTVEFTCYDAFGLASNTATVNVNVQNSAPSASISGSSPSSVPIGIASGTFTSSCIDPEGQPMTRNWTFGAGASPATSTAANPSGIVWSSTGSKTVTLVCTDSYGASSPQATHSVNVYNTRPDGSISAPAGTWDPFNGGFIDILDDNNSNYQNGTTDVAIGSQYIEDFALQVCMTNDSDFEGDMAIRLASPATGYFTMWGRGAHAGGCQTIYPSSFDDTNPNGTWTLGGDDNDCHSGLFGCRSGDEGDINSWRLDIYHGPTIFAGNSVNFAGSCSDADGHSWTATWTFEARDGGPAPGPVVGTDVNVQFNNAGNYRATLTCTDEWGLSDAMPPVSVTVRVQ